jgi:hypothetical protein
LETLPIIPPVGTVELAVALVDIDCRAQSHRFIVITASLSHDADRR